MTDSPVIIVGAARSGTKMLREFLCSHPALLGIDYELERIWCQGNPGKMWGHLAVEDLTPDIKRNIRRFFKKKRAKSGLLIVEKNTAHSLRLDYVRSVFPESPIIHILRDGRDASLSASKRWRSPLDLNYILKNKKFPLGELPYFIARQIKYYGYKIFNSNDHVKLWGPRFDNIRECVEKYSLIEVCGIQWSKSVDQILNSRTCREKKRYIEVRYEEIVFKPLQEISRLMAFLDLSVTRDVEAKANNFVNTSSVGKWKKLLCDDDLRLLMPHIEKSMDLTGYI